MGKHRAGTWVGGGKLGGTFPRQRRNRDKSPLRWSNKENGQPNIGRGAFKVGWLSERYATTFSIADKASQGWRRRCAHCWSPGTGHPRYHLGTGQTALQESECQKSESPQTRADPRPQCSVRLMGSESTCRLLCGGGAQFNSPLPSPPLRVTHRRGGSIPPPLKGDASQGGGVQTPPP